MKSTLKQRITLGFVAFVFAAGVFFGPVQSLTTANAAPVQTVAAQTLQVAQPTTAQDKSQKLDKAIAALKDRIAKLDAQIKKLDQEIKKQDNQPQKKAKLEARRDKLQAHKAQLEKKLAQLEQRKKDLSNGQGKTKTKKNTSPANN